MQTNEFTLLLRCGLRLGLVVAFAMSFLNPPKALALSILGNQYAFGADALGQPGRIRYHTDDSIKVKYYDHPERLLDKATFSLTGDAGCERGGGVSCAGDSVKVVAGQRVIWP